MWATIKVFFKALGWYLLLTIPALPLYFMSAFFAVAVCWIAGVFFILTAYFIKQLNGKHSYKIAALYFVAIIAVLLAFQYIEIFGLWKNIWEDKGFLLFPLAALIAAWIGIYTTRHELAAYFNNQTDTNEDNLQATTL